MILDTLASWHALVESRDPAALDALLHEDVVFYSPVVHGAQPGKAITKMYLQAALHVLANDSFRYVRELTDGQGAVLEFEVEIDGVFVNGVDLIKWNDEGKIEEFKVMLRPMKAINLIREKMAQLLQYAGNGS
jgi:hypothetical protein